MHDTPANICSTHERIDGLIIDPIALHTALKPYNCLSLHAPDMRWLGWIERAHY